MEKPTHIYLAQIPNFCGYGICVLAHRQDEAICLLRDKYNEWRKHNVLDSNMDTFKKALDYFGGGVKKVEIGKTYFDEFTS